MKQQQLTLTPRLIIRLILIVIVLPFLPLLVSWRWSWWEAWVYGFVFAVGFIVSRVLANQRHPDLLAERAQSLEQENAKAWDKILVPILMFGLILVPLVAGLEARFSWSPTFSLPVRLASLVIIFLGYALGAYALIENRFFSGVVRIQSERGHHVVSSGPYGWVRHPGYASTLLAYGASPLFLNSVWAFLPVFLLTIVLVIRTYLEDRTLQDELDGYSQYVRQVRYRLLPGIW